MAENSRISKKPAVFDAYINNTDDSLQLALPVPVTNVRLGWPSVNKDDWHDYRLEWEGDLYPIYTDKAKCTSVTREDVKEFIANFRLFANPLLDIAAASTGATSEDAALFNFKIGRKNPTHQTAEMTAKTFMLAEDIGGGKIVFRCRTASDSKRARIPTEIGADSVQFAYMIDTLPTSPDDCNHIMVSTKSKFTLSNGTSPVRRKLHGYMRWYNTRNPKIAAPWSAMFTIEFS